ncbi:undecaprenyldiphospho-muramoylpentapeptide beta-N-acetylglucosaminyltransferase [Paenibacillus paeoniae]|uniref:UDP-N-acetylglucosamine--N-acetylmuramyl-(pentapeptide) pyrophosphoryl-undecaprenol N-acetylglucosamine transferase n=1 Tax=Paenibacillus paeoniae TaxID=2292705 RepID=A0A371PKL5_9BACL|nr:undecaprenyldiphospho-muramoylpentapeptide beta-N-acetylglucosaminyltransferase [Paenibacillus paeoniae]REK76693.1 undecaprenyldiphospho-muramoylpentapeptide beta-N-acetylglucosaminyltransferase [Paenibacillus paeoniae]
MKNIMFTGGGSAGHVTVNIALIPKLAESGWSTAYIGSNDGIERRLVAELPQVSYHSISTGKLRRYMSWQNMKDPFRVVKGIFQAYRIIKKDKPDVVFSKGGFVSVPVVMAAWMNRVPVIIHESDITPGLANRLASPFATVICTTFPETARAIGEKKSRYVGAVIRENLKQGNADHGRSFTGLPDNGKPVLLIMGGSLGARRINEAVRHALPELTKAYQIIHLCGKGQLEGTIRLPDYRQYEYVNEQLPDLLAMSSCIISRAGSNSIFEFLSLRKPMLLIPLTKQQSRGDQLLNAASFERSGYCKVLHEEKLNSESLIASVQDLSRNKQAYLRSMDQYDAQDALTAVYEIIMETAKG